MDIENALKEMMADDSAAIISVDFAKAVLKQIREYEGQLNTAENELIELRAKLAVQDSLISDIEFVCNSIQNETATQVCCGRPAWIECCGSPDVDWPSWATEAMTKLSSVRDSLIEATLSHSQQRCNIGNAESHDKELQVTVEHNGKIFGVDESISEFVQLLNSVGLETVASCSGHGHRPANIALKDGREIIIARNYEEGREIDRIFPVDINGDRRQNNESEQQIPECFKKLTRHAVGMCFGTDWNNGTAATIHRENLINSAWECDKYLSENSHESEQGRYPMNNTPPEKILSRLILCDEEGRQGNICSGLVQNFKAGTCQFNVRHADGSVYRVTVKQEEMEPANDGQLLSHDSEQGGEV